ncbi:MAG TPA: PilZ domain-containing protein [Spirochaetales bacterium]|nr:PilZ domain-containing protein [Spirochaetales bacterium]HRY55625.1 PilZ domain-containing protein [Spirochaetia bacterium]HRZ64762.1 PilZ domain-containing protein [Spirochaetia bacterium]
MEEKRKSPRFKINQLIAYLPNREEYLYAEGLDLSRGGMKCRSSQLVEPMTNLFMMLKLPQPGAEMRTVQCEGYVSHARMDGPSCVFGVTINSVFEDDKAFFDSYMASLEAGPPTA